MPIPDFTSSNPGYVFEPGYIFIDERRGSGAPKGARVLIRATPADVATGVHFGRGGAPQTRSRGAQTNDAVCATFRARHLLAGALAFRRSTAALA